MARAINTEAIEAPPEADRLGDFPHPRMTRTLFGHSAGEHTLCHLFASGRMHHGWLITGPVGIGKATLAYRMARHVLAAPHERDGTEGSLTVGDDTSASRQVRALSHPGLLVVRRPYDSKTKRFPSSITVDEVRRLKAFLGHSADDRTWRVVIVDPVDDLNANAANALLKALEEPPARTLFLLPCAEPGRLLITIRSRCRTLDLAPLAAADVEAAAHAALAAAGKPLPADAVRANILAHADGSVRRYLALAASDDLALRARIETMVHRLPQVDWNGVHALADEMANATAAERFDTAIEMLLDIVAGLVRARVGGGGTPALLATANRMIPAGRVGALTDLYAAILREKSDLDALNLDRKTLLLTIMRRLEKLATA